MTSRDLVGSKIVRYDARPFRRRRHGGGACDPVFTLDNGRAKPVAPTGEMIRLCSTCSPN